jgi:hypothetical protein
MAEIHTTPGSQCKVLSVGKFLPFKVELTVYISCPKEGFLQGISQIIFHTTAG